MLIIRAQHYTDAPLVDSIRRRVLKNWSNFKEPGRDWLPTSIVAALSTGAPDNWGDDDYVFEKEVRANPLQAYYADKNDADNSASVSCRRADDPECKISFKALDVSDTLVRSYPTVGGCKFADIYTDTDIEYESVPGKLKEKITLKKSGHPLTFRFSVKIPDGYSLEFRGNSAVLLDSHGTEKLRIEAPWGVDSSTVYPDTLDGKKSIPVKLQRGNDVGGLLVAELVLDQKDLDGAVYPIEIDPTTETISGTIDIEDNWLWLGNPAFNQGNSATLQIGRSGNERRPIIRIAPSSIPAGNITGFRLFIFTRSNADGVAWAWIVTDANDWGELTSNWNTHDGTNPWAGSAGCGTHGIDTDAGDYSTMALGSLGWHTFTLKPEWPPLWRDSIRAPNGILIRRWWGTLIPSLWSSEGSSPYQLYFGIDYLPAGGGNAQRFFFMGSS